MEKGIALLLLSFFVRTVTFDEIAREALVLRDELNVLNERVNGSVREGWVTD